MCQRHTKIRHLSLWLNSDILSVRVATSLNLEVALLDIARDLVKARADLAGLPGRNTRVEDVVHLFESLALGLRRGQEHVDESEGVEGAEDLLSC